MSKAYLAETYRSLSTIELRSPARGGTQSSVAAARRARGRGIDPVELNENYLNDLLVEAGHAGGVEARSSGDPTWSRHWKLESLKDFATGHPIMFSVAIVGITFLPDFIWYTIGPIVKSEFPVMGAYEWYGISPYGFSPACMSCGDLAGSDRRDLGDCREIEPLAGDDLLPGDRGCHGSIRHIRRLAARIYSVCLGGRVQPFLSDRRNLRGDRVSWIILYGLLRRYGNTQEGIFWRVVLSSVLFGLVHFSVDECSRDHENAGHGPERFLLRRLDGAREVSLDTRGLPRPEQCRAHHNIVDLVLRRADAPIPYPEFWLILANVLAVLCGFCSHPQDAAQQGRWRRRNCWHSFEPLLPHSPLNCASSFSRNAATPSLSNVAQESACRYDSESAPGERPVGEGDTLPWRNVSRASGCAARLSARVRVLAMRSARGATSPTRPMARAAVDGLAGEDDLGRAHADQARQAPGVLPALGTIPSLTRLSHARRPLRRRRWCRPWPARDRSPWPSR